MNHPVPRLWLMVSAILALCASGVWAQDAEPPRTDQPATEAEQPAPPSFPDQRPSADWIDTLPSGQRLAVIRVEGMIYGFTLDSIQRRIDRARQDGFDVLVLELDTNGGAVDAALDISAELKKLPEPTIAWVNDRAYSAGIMIAASCDAIIMSTASATGDCAPIVPGQELAPTERAKALSPILENFAHSAEVNGYDYALFHAMCVLGIRVYLIEDPATGERRAVNEVDYDYMVRGVEPTAEQDTGGVVKGVRTLPDGTVVVEQQADEIGGAMLTVGPEQKGRWELVERIHDGSTLLTLSELRAVKYGLARDKDVNSVRDVEQLLRAGTARRVSVTWSEGLVGWLTHPAVRAVLVLALLLGAYVEFQTPGLGVAGAVALLALITLLGAPFLVGLAEVWHILVFFLGLLLIVIEVFFTPGFGLLGAMGLFGMFTGLVLSAVPTSGDGLVPLPDPVFMGQLQQSALWSLLAFIGAFVGFCFLTAYFQRIPGLQHLVLASPTPAPREGVEVSGDEVIAEGKIRVGATGRTVDVLRPNGYADIDGHVVDVTCDTGWVDPDRRVRVTRVEGNRITVEPADD